MSRILTIIKLSFATVNENLKRKLCQGTRGKKLIDCGILNNNNNNLKCFKSEENFPEIHLDLNSDDENERKSKKCEPFT